MAGAADLRGNSKLIRWSGLAAMLGGLLLMVMFLLRAMFMQDPNRTVLGFTAGDPQFMQAMKFAADRGYGPLRQSVEVDNIGPILVMSPIDALKAMGEYE